MLTPPCYFLEILDFGGVFSNAKRSKIWALVLNWSLEQGTKPQPAAKAGLRVMYTILWGCFLFVYFWFFFCLLLSKKSQISNIPFGLMQG